MCYLRLSTVMNASTYKLCVSTKKKKMFNWHPELYARLSIMNFKFYKDIKIKFWHPCDQLLKSQLMGTFLLSGTDKTIMWLDLKYCLQEMIEVSCLITGRRWREGASTHPSFLKVSYERMRDRIFSFMCVIHLFTDNTR